MSTIADLRPRLETGGEGSLSVSDSLELGNEFARLFVCNINIVSSYCKC